MAGLCGTILLSVGACSDPIELEPEVQTNPEVYIRRMCEDLCAKHVECSPVPEGVDPCTVEACEDASWTMIDSPCFEHEDEFFRCRTERLSCEEFFDPQFVGSSAACDEFIVLLDECRDRNR